MSSFGAGRWRNLLKSAHVQNREDMNKFVSVMLGFLAAPLIPAIYYGILYPLGGNRDPVSVVGTFVVAYLVAVTGGVFLGVPIFLLLNKLSLIRWWSAVCSGSLLGMVLRIAITPRNLDFHSSLLFIVFGGIGGLVFWTFWRIGNKQKDQVRQT
jgi:hypothetical protein